MGEIASAYVSIYPKFTDGYASKIKQETQTGVDSGLQDSGKNAGQAGTATGKKFGDAAAVQVEKKTEEAVAKGGTSSAVATAGKASGKKFGESFASTAQKAATILAIAGAVGSQVQSGIDKSEGSVSSMSAAAALSVKNLSALNTEFDKVQTKILIWQGGIPRAKDFADALGQVVNNGKGFNAVLNTTTGFISGMVGLKTDAKELADQMGKLDQALAGMDAAKAQAAFAQVSAAATKQGISVDDLLKQFPEYEAGLQNQAAALGVTNLANQDYADWMGGKLPAAITAAANAQPELAKQMGVVTSTMADATTLTALNTASLKANSAAVQTNAQKLQTQIDKRLRLSGGKDAFEASIDDVTAALKANGKTLDSHTEKGRANRAALRGLSEGTRSYVQELKDQHKPQTQINAAMDEGRAAFIKAATAATGSATAAKKLATQWGLLHSKKITLEANVKKTGVTTVTFERANGSSAANPRFTVVAKKFGGAITGGIRGVDSVPVMAEPDEHMLTTADVRAMGGQAEVYRFRAALHSNNRRGSAVAAGNIDYDQFAAAVVRGLRAEGISMLTIANGVTAAQATARRRA